MSSADWTFQTSFATAASTTLGVGNVSYASKAGLMRDTNKVDMCLTGDPRVLALQNTRMASETPAGQSDLGASISTAVQMTSASANPVILLVVNASVSSQQLGAATVVATSAHHNTTFFVISVGDSSSTRLSPLASSSNNFVALSDFSSLNTALVSLQKMRCLQERTVV